MFYSRDQRIKYCSENCREIGYKLVQKKNHKRWCDKNRKHNKKYKKNYYIKNKEEKNVKN